MSYASKAASLKIQWAAFLVRVLMATVLFAVFDCRHVWVTVDMLSAIRFTSMNP